MDESTLNPAWMESSAAAIGLPIAAERCRGSPRPPGAHCRDGCAAARPVPFPMRSNRRRFLRLVSLS